MALLEVQDLHLFYSAGERVVRAVDGVSFTIAGKGEAVGVVGESGSGKTSLANALMRLLPKNVVRLDGSVRLDGQELAELSDDAYRRQVRWRRIAMVFQGAMNVLNPVLRVGDQIAEPLLLDEQMEKRVARQRVEGLLDRVGLSADFYGRYPHELSGGQKQRVVIATALVLDPDLLILDEPTSALDVSVQAQIMNLLKDLKEDPGISMIFITHDIGLASDLCDTIAVAYAAEHVEYGRRSGSWSGRSTPTPNCCSPACPASTARSGRGRCRASRPTRPISRPAAASTLVAPTGSTPAISTLLPS